MSQQNPHQFQPQGPAAYASPQPPPPGGPVSPGEPGAKPAKVRNTIAIVALAAAIAGFVFAVVEGAYILGWVLLPIAFVLSLVALFQRDKPKKMALAALIIVIVGTVAGAIAFLSSAARVNDAAFSGGEVAATAPPHVRAGQPDPHLSGRRLQHADGGHRQLCDECRQRDQRT